MWVQSLDQEDPLEKETATHSSISCLENSMDKGYSLVGYSPWACKESDTTKYTPVWLENIHRELSVPTEPCCSIRMTGMPMAMEKSN